MKVEGRSARSVFAFGQQTAAQFRNAAAQFRNAAPQQEEWIERNGRVREPMGR